MANNWDPDDPGAIGSAWYPIIGSTWPVAEGEQAFVQRLRSTNAKTITALRPAIESDPSVTAPLFTLLEVIPDGSERPAVSTVEYTPNADSAIGNWRTGSPPGGTVNLWARIDDPVVFPPTGTDYIINITGGLSGYRGFFASSGFPLTARVCKIVSRAIVGLDPNKTSTIPRKFTFQLFHSPTSTTWQPAGAEFVNNGLAPNPCEVNYGELNPITELPWTPNDIREFDGGDWEVRVVSQGSAACGAIVVALSLQVFYVTTENRAAVGTWSRPPGALARVIETDALVHLTGGNWAADWSKPASGDFLYLWRRAIGRLLNPSLTVAGDIRWLHAYQDLGTAGNPAGLSYPPVPGMAADQLTIDSNGIPTTDFAGDSVRTARLVLRTSAPADDDDSQPYFVRFDATVLRQVHTTQPVGQLITPSSSQSYLGVKFVVIPPSSADGRLRAGVFNASTGAQLGGTFEITADEIRALPQISGQLYRYVEGFLPTAAALVSGTQYELRLSTPDITSADPFLVALPDTDGNGSSSFQGTTDAARLNGTGGTVLTGQDAMMQLLIQPAAPTELTTKVIAVPRSGAGALCTPEATDQVVVAWTATTLAGSWLRYEIERLRDDVAAAWQPIATVTSSEAKTSWADPTPPRNRRVKYRVRVVATTTAVSDWATGDWVEPASYGSEMIFTSAHEPGMEVVVDYEPSKATDFPDHDSDVEVAIYGTDNVVAFREPEDRGLILKVRLIVSAQVAPCDDLGKPVPDDRVWDPLRAISRASLPYVVVLDARGNYMQATVKLGNGETVYDATELAFYWCDATIRPVGSGVPTPVEV